MSSSWKGIAKSGSDSSTLICSRTSSLNSWIISSPTIFSFTKNPDAPRLLQVKGWEILHLKQGIHWIHVCTFLNALHGQAVPRSKVVLEERLSCWTVKMALGHGVQRACMVWRCDVGFHAMISEAFLLLKQENTGMVFRSWKGLVVYDLSTLVPEVFKGGFSVLELELCSLQWPRSDTH